jgi:ABC-type amino acid transport system permease subunit
MTLVAVLFCAVLAALAVFQGLLIGGAPLGEYAWGGQHRVLPRRLRIGSLVSIALYAAFGMVALAKTGVVELFPGTPVVDVAMWVLAGYLTLGVPMNAISRSRKERLVMTPTALALAGLAIALAVS